MDLDHVCTVHKRWFRDLRIVTQRPDYVEYRLTSLFYGLRQKVTARGAPIDANHYWYEFLAPLAKMRVEGLLEGEDGNLTQTEEITFRFPWIFAPVFWVLRPLFRKQKEDILHDDTTLLEREYELQSTGFKRVEMSLPKVVVYGGDGFFGRLVVKDLLENSRAEIIIVSRHPRAIEFPSFETRIRRVESDMKEYAAVLSTIEGTTVVVNCVGPFQGQSLNILQACMEKRIAYVDVADDCDFVVRCHELSAKIKAAGIAAFVGCSVVPGMSSLLTKYCQLEIPRIRRTKICISPGTKHPRGQGSFLCLLATIGNEFTVPNGAGEKAIRGWTGRERVDFPPPIGGRWVYSVVDIADYFVQPTYFGVEDVEFKIGSELDILNRSLSCLRESKRVLGLKNIDWLFPASRALVFAASLFGTSQGGVMVEVTGDGCAASLSVFAEERGEMIPAILPSLATQMILRRELDCHGIVSLPDWLTRERLTEELTKRHVRIAERRGEVWSSCN